MDNGSNSNNNLSIKTQIQSNNLKLYFSNRIKENFINQLRKKDLIRERKMTKSVKLNNSSTAKINSTTSSSVKEPINKSNMYIDSKIYEIAIDKLFYFMKIFLHKFSFEKITEKFIEEFENSVKIYNDIKNKKSLYVEYIPKTNILEMIKNKNNISKTHCKNHSCDEDELKSKKRMKIYLNLLGNLRSRKNKFMKNNLLKNNCSNFSNGSTVSNNNTMNYYTSNNLLYQLNNNNLINSNKQPKRINSSFHGNSLNLIGQKIVKKKSRKIKDLSKINNINNSITHNYNSSIISNNSNNLNHNIRCFKLINKYNSNNLKRQRKDISKSNLSISNASQNQSNHSLFSLKKNAEHNDIKEETGSKSNSENYLSTKRNKNLNLLDLKKITESLQKNKKKFNYLTLNKNKKKNDTESENNKNINISISYNNQKISNKKASISKSINNKSSYQNKNTYNDLYNNLKRANFLSSRYSHSSSPRNSSKAQQKSINIKFTNNKDSNLNLYYINNFINNLQQNSDKSRKNKRSKKKKLNKSNFTDGSESNNISLLFRPNKLLINNNEKATTDLQANYKKINNPKKIIVLNNYINSNINQEHNGEIVGMDNDKIEKKSSEQLKQIKSSLDESLKVMFNFSYEDFLNNKESESESIVSSHEDKHDLLTNK